MLAERGGELISSVKAPIASGVANMGGDLISSHISIAVTTRISAYATGTFGSTWPIVSRGGSFPRVSVLVGMRVVSGSGLVGPVVSAVSATVSSLGSRI